MHAVARKSSYTFRVVGDLDDSEIFGVLFYPAPPPSPHIPDKLV